MITGELKNKIDGLWDIFASGGLVNPLEVIEQITYLMFIHDLDDLDNKRAKESAMLGLPFESIYAEDVEIGDRVIDGTQLKWSAFRDFRQKECTVSCRSGCSLLLKLCTMTRIVHTQNIWMMLFLKFQLR